VFRAWQEPPGRTVLLKCSRDAEGAHRLRREAKLLSSLAGGPVPSLLSFRDDSRHALLILEWLDGVSLADVPVAELSLAQRQGLLLGACRAVAHLHGAGLVHGDLSRTNLLARSNPGVEIVDLGVAFRLGEEPAGLGAWEIVSPEALRGERLSPACDVYALGCQALFLFDAVPEDLRTSRSRWSEAALSGELMRFGQSIHPALAAALSPDPGLRPCDASLLLESLLEDPAWRHPGWPGELLAAARIRHEDRLLELQAERCSRSHDWDGAWRWQKERVEASDNPEALLPSLSEYARRKAALAASRRWQAVAGAVLLLCAVVVGLFVWHRDAAFERGIRAGTLRSFDESADSLLYPSSTTSRNDVLLPLRIGPQPPSARLWIDGQPEELPVDDTLWMGPGEHHVELRDAAGNLLRDTLVHLRERKRRKVQHPDTHRPQSPDTAGKSFPATSHEGRTGDPQTVG
jgi:serine/threonine protein kinase